MKRLLGLLLAATLVTTLVACGDEAGPGGGVASDAPSDTGPTDRETSTGPTDPGSTVPPGYGNRVVAILNESAAGGETATSVTVLDSDGAVEDYVGQFTGPTLADQIRDAVDSAAPESSQVVIAAVIAIGCEVPTGAKVEIGDAPSLLPEGLVKSDKQCLVPITTVAVAVVDADSVRDSS